MAKSGNVTVSKSGSFWSCQEWQWCVPKNSQKWQLCDLALSMELPRMAKIGNVYVSLELPGMAMVCA